MSDERLFELKQYTGFIEEKDRKNFITAFRKALEDPNKNGFLNNALKRYAAEHYQRQVDPLIAVFKGFSAISSTDSKVY